MTSANAEELKRQAALQALSYVQSGMVLGLGTGTTVAHLLELLAEALTSGSLTDIVGVPTSEWTTREARRLGIELVALSGTRKLDLTIDGADEVSPRVDLIKGMGGALLREKMVAQASERGVIIADDRKRVERLGTVSPLPVEVIEWGYPAQVRFLETLGAEVSVRQGDDGRPFVTDNGHLILDCSFEGGIADAEEVERAVQGRAGIVESGLFLGLADEAFIASRDGVRHLRRDF